jgi:SAM-dependent methyltransferase
MTKVFEELVAEGDSEPVEGWDFSWFEGRATEERPRWAYARNLVTRVAKAGAVLDVQTGGGEVFAGVLRQADNVPGMVAATEPWPPNVDIARTNLAPFGGEVTQVADDEDLPYPSESFDLVISRHPTNVVWKEIWRVLETGGLYFSQEVGPGSNRELTDFMMGRQPVSDDRDPRRAVADAVDAGLDVVDLREQSLEVRFFDVGAVVYFLRKVLWTVPGFSVEGYRDRMVAMDETIRLDGSFVSYAQRFLIEARRP